jgi:hypothetical protein
MAIERRQIAELKAYDAMCRFLERYWESRGKQDDGIAILLGGLNRELRRSGLPVDPAMWSDWQRAVDHVLVSEDDRDEFLNDRLPPASEA